MTGNRGQHVPKYVMMVIYLIYIYINICSYFDFVIYGFWDRYMICSGFLTGRSKYSRRISYALRVMYRVDIWPNSDQPPPPPNWCIMPQWGIVDHMVPIGNKLESYRLLIPRKCLSLAWPYINGLFLLSSFSVYSGFLYVEWSEVWS